jgi:hypothetical protein
MPEEEIRAMVVAWLILICSMAMIFFYFQVTCQRILRRQFDREYSRAVVNANRLEFPSLRQSLERFGDPADYPRLRMILMCDFLALTYLLKNSGSAKQRYSMEEWTLILYFRCLFLSLAALRLFRFGEKKAALRLTSILQYFANVVGERAKNLSFDNLTAASFLLNL